MRFFDTAAAVGDEPDLLGYVPVIERAWQSLGLSGVLFAQGRPVLYLNESLRPLDLGERVRLHRLFWNQGVANVLVLADPSHVYLYSALARPLGDQTAEDERALVETLKQADYAQHAMAFLASLASGAYYERHRAKFDPSETVDVYLLNQLEALRDELCEGAAALRKEMAHALLGRLLFSCYLLDRKIVFLDDRSTSAEAVGAAQLGARLEGLATFERRRDFLYDWFAKLQRQFNGTMFDQDMQAERAALRSRHLDAVVQFLGCHEVRSGQRTLSFWAYDFHMIPVETISAIYESFLAGEGEQAKREAGAFYTPRFLAEMVLDVATEGMQDFASKRWLDPACGSGIFLVALFSRMATVWLRDTADNPSYAARIKAFQGILRDRLRGIDRDETACRIACFSLYLAYLDRLDPPDILRHAKTTGKALPRLLVTELGGLSRQDNLIPVVRRADALEDTPDCSQAFDFVVGNPPWRERQDRLAQRFVEKTPDFLRPGGVACLLLPTALLLNRTAVAFQLGWLRRVTLERIVNLADYSFVLFQHSKRPAFIARFRNQQPRAETATVQADAPKFRRDSLREGCITISPVDRSWISLPSILAAARKKAAPVVWKRHLWGTPRDQKLLDLLLDMPALGNHVEVLSSLRRERGGRHKIWVIGQGIKPWRGDATRADRPLKPIPQTANLLLLPATRWTSDLVALPREAVPLSEALAARGYRRDVLYSSPDPALFTPPMVLVSQGFGKVAFCNFPVRFQHTIQSISGPAKDAELLMFLAAYLRSPLARYFLFHTAANWGTERDKVHLDELLRLPFPLPGSEYASRRGEGIVKEAGKCLRQLRKTLDADLAADGLLQRREAVASTQAHLNGLVSEYFGLTKQEVMLIEDTVEVSIPSSTPHSWWAEDVPTLDSVNRSSRERYKTGLRPYADTLTQTLNEWASERGSNHCVIAAGGLDEESGLALVELELADRKAAFRQADVSKNLWRELNAYRQGAARLDQNTLAIERDIVICDKKKRIYVIRPGILANWTRTAALNDAARLYAEIAISGKSRE